MDEHRRKFLIAKALWEFIAEDSKRPPERRSASDVDDMERILDEDYPAETSTLMRLEKHKNRHKQ